MPGDTTGKSRATAADTNPPAVAPDPIQELQNEATLLKAQIDADRKALADDPNGTTLASIDAGKRLVGEESQYRGFLNTLVQYSMVRPTSKMPFGPATASDPWIVTVAPDGGFQTTRNPNFNQALYDQPGFQAKLVQAQADLDKAKADHDNAQTVLDNEYKKQQLSLQDYTAKTNALHEQQLVEIDRIRAGIEQQNADTSRLGVEQAGPIEAMRAAGAIGDAAVRGNLIPSMLPYMVPKGGLNNFNSALAALGAVSGAKVAPTVTAPMPPFDPTTVGGQTSANALASLTASQNTLPAVSNFQAPRLAPSPVVAGASVQPVAAQPVAAQPVAAQPVAAQPAATPLAAPPSLEQILQSARAQVIGPNAPSYGGQVMPPVMAGRSS